MLDIDWDELDRLHAAANEAGVPPWGVPWGVPYNAERTEFLVALRNAYPALRDRVRYCTRFSAEMEKQRDDAVRERDDLRAEVERLRESASSAVVDIDEAVEIMRTFERGKWDARHGRDEALRQRDEARAEVDRLRQRVTELENSSYTPGDMQIACDKVKLLEDEVERLRIELDLMRGRAERAEAACSEAASRLAQWMPVYTETKRDAAAQDSGEGNAGHG